MDNQKKQSKFLEDRVATAEQLAAGNNNMLPPASWLIENGYYALYQTVMKYPELFEHIKRQKKTKSLEEWVIVVEKIVANNNGVLPPSSWLKENGYYALYQTVMKYPELFKHIRREKKAKSLEEWMLMVEKLVEENKGVLPSASWLQQNGYGKLYRIVLRYPELFKHIEREKKGQFSKNWVLIAEKLATDNNNVLPSSHWLRNNGHRGLYDAMRQRPNLFLYLKQEDNLRKSLKDWILIADKLVKENEGVSLSPAWLEQYGYSRLNHIRHEYPTLFKEINQKIESKWKIVRDEYVQIAEKLSANNNNVLPSSYWLQKNGYYALYCAIKKYPKLFSHLKRIKRTKSLNEWVLIAEKIAKKNKCTFISHDFLMKNNYAYLYDVIMRHPEAFSHVYQIRKKLRKIIKIFPQ